MLVGFRIRGARLEKRASTGLRKKKTLSSRGGTVVIKHEPRVMFVRREGRIESTDQALSVRFKANPFRAAYGPARGVRERSTNDTR